MRCMKFLLIIFLFAGCSDNPDNNEQQAEDTPVVPIEPIEDTSNVGVDSTQIRFGWLDSLQSDNASSRLAAFKRYKKERQTSDGDASEMLAGYMKTYFYSRPKEFLSSYAFMNQSERIKIQGDIAEGIYASSDKQYQRDIDEYFGDIAKSCEDCSADLKKLLKDFKTKVEVRAKEIAN